MKFRYAYGPKECQAIRDALEDALASEEAVFIIIGRGNKITDAYKDVCEGCVKEKIEEVINDATKIGLLSKCAEKKGGN